MAGRRGRWRIMGVVGTLVAMALGAAGSASAQGLDALWPRLDEAMAEVPRDRFDPAAVVTTVGTHPADLFRWVRDETLPLAYLGVLKGPEGVLLDRAGNALDRALLLRELLMLAGHRAYLATATLTAEEAAAVAATLGARPATGAPRADVQDLAARAATELDLDGDLVATALTAAHAAAAARAGAVADRAARQADALLAALGDGPAIDLEPLVADHWWVQWDPGDGRRIDLDPSLPTGEPGDRRVEATGVYDPASLAELAALGRLCVGAWCGDRLHGLTVRAVAETFDGEALVEHVLLERALLPAAILGTPLALATEAFGGDGPPDPFAEADAAAGLRAALLARAEWRPVLAVGDERVEGRVVSADGQVSDEPGGRAAPSAGGLGGFGGFGGLAGGGASADDGADAASGRFTALWWEFEVAIPGVGTAVERREAFDLLGPAARAAGTVSEPQPDEAGRLVRALALEAQTELAAWPAAPDGGDLDLRAATRLRAERDAWDELARLGTAIGAEALNERLVALGALRTPLERFALARAAAADAGAGPATGLRVVAHHRWLRPDLTRAEAYDLIAVPADAHGTFAGRVRAGALDAALETALVAPDAAAPTVATVFDRDPGSWVLVRSPAELAGAAPALPADMAARVAADLAAGHLALVPTAPEDAVGWWRVDPATGATLALGDRGWGQALAGYAERTSVVLQLRTVINQYASMGQCLGYAISQPLQGITGVGEELQQCIFNLVCGQINSALGNLTDGADANWLNVIVMATIDAAWGGVPEVGFGGMCGRLWERLASGR